MVNYTYRGQISTDTKREAEPDVSTNEESAPKRPRESQLQKICEACDQGLKEFSEIKIEDLQKNDKGVPIISFHFDSPTCALCMMLRAYLVRVGCKNPSQHALHAVSFLRCSRVVEYGACDKKTHVQDIACLKASLKGLQEFIFCLRTIGQQPKAFLPQALKPNVDLLRCKEWIYHCRDHHSESCGDQGPPPEQSSLIDCESREVVSAVPHTPYVALSYVWGV